MRRAVVAVPLALLAVGIARPALAGRTFATMVVIVAIVALATMVDQRWSHLAAAPIEPFVADDPPVPSGVVTPEIADLRRALDRRPGDAIPPNVGGRIAEAARGRLLDDHHLDARQHACHDDLRALVGPDLYDIVTAAPDQQPRLPMHRLSDVLDEVERL